MLSEKNGGFHPSEKQALCPIVNTIKPGLNWFATKRWIMTTITTKNEATKEGNFMVALPSENQGRRIPVTWMSSPAREVPVTKNETNE